MIVFGGIEAGALFDELVGADPSIMVEVGTEVSVAKDDGTWIARVEVCNDALHRYKLLRCARFTGFTVLVESSFVADTY